MKKPVGSESDLYRTLTEITASVHCLIYDAEHFPIPVIVDDFD